MADETCYLCGKKTPVPLKKHRGKLWHNPCLRKLRRKAKKKFAGNLDAAFKALKENNGGF